MGHGKKRANNSEQLTQPDPKPAGINMVSLRRVCCVYPVSFLHPFIRPFDRLAACLRVWVGWSLTRVLTRLVASGLWTTRSVVPAWSRVNPSLVILAKDAVDCRAARKRKFFSKKLLSKITLRSLSSWRRLLHIWYTSVLTMWHYVKFFTPFLTN